MEVDGRGIIQHPSIEPTELIDEDCLVREMNNITLDANPAEFFNFFMYGILLNSVGILGLIGNIISITILSR